MGKKIKGNQVLVVGAGSSLARYWDDIEQFIDRENVITVGINRINHILTPDYHFWLDVNVYSHFKEGISKDSVACFGNHFDKKMLAKDGHSSYKIIKYTKLKWKDSYDDVNHKSYKGGEIKYNKKTKEFHGVFRAAGSLAILWAHIKKASKISVVGMDGYTFYSEEKLKSRQKDSRQHCYGKGYSDAIARNRSQKDLEGKQKSKEFYAHASKKDRDIYKTLQAIKRYGVEFEILTPTVYKDFYNPNVLR